MKDAIDEHLEQDDIEVERTLSDFVLRKYQPADSWDDSDTQLTTFQIKNAFASHTGFDISHDYLYHWMKEYGFNDDSLEEMDMVWLLKKKS